MNEDKIEYLEKYSVGIVGSRLLFEILWRSGIGCIRYVSDFITTFETLYDCSLNPLEANNYDIVHPKSDDSCVISYLYPEKKSELRKLLGGVDLVVAHKHIAEVAEVSEQIGVPFIPDIVTVFLPDGIGFKEVEYPIFERDPVSYTITCGFQALEMMKIFAGLKPIIAPEAIIVDLEEGVKKICLKTLV
ncbi:MAG: hypothetical protein RMH75_00150 [Archaeoglobaceae archaeon]|nr:hypothetical protein [Archaeoglobaceae archaeon]MDW7989071.1 hypothetical protein [Archaeoglobaceae archaeon]